MAGFVDEKKSRRFVMMFGGEGCLKKIAEQIVSHEKRIHPRETATDQRIAFGAAEQLE